MSVSFSVIGVIILGLLGFFVGTWRARSIEAHGTKMHSRSQYYGWWVFLVTVIPTVLFLTLWHIGTSVYLEHRAHDAISTMIAANSEVALDAGGPGGPNGPDNIAQSGTAGGTTQSLNLVLSTVKALLVQPDLLLQFSNNVAYADVRTQFSAHGFVVPLQSPDYVVKVARQWALTNKTLTSIGLAMGLVLAVASFCWGLGRITATARARNKVEKVVLSGLVLASTIAILTTIGIILSMFFQTVAFFQSVSLFDFFFGHVWDPGFAAAGSGGSVGQFGLLPLLAGTLYIAFVAMLFAVPVGLFAAVYMAEYASSRWRAVIKPLLEVLAGIPTIVYGFFALMTVGPLLRDLSKVLAGGHEFIMARSVLTAGLVMGIMLIPFVSSLSDDIITAVPKSLRDGSYGLGATQSETIKKIIMPAAFPGIVGALLLTASRAIGETMIVVLAAGVAANLTINPFEAMTTMTVKIVNQLTGDLEFNSPQTLVAFALGMTLFVLTLMMNIFALYIVRKYREQYE